MDTKQIVTNIIGSDVNGYSRVTIANDLFRELIGSTPKNQNYEELNSGKEGVYIRKFKIKIDEEKSVEIYSNYEANIKRTFFIMNTKEAKEHMSKSSSAPYDFGEFDTTITKTGEVA